MNVRSLLCLCVLAGGCFTDAVPERDPMMDGERQPVPVEATSSDDTSGGETTGDATSGTGAEPRCGNGVREAGEACDDGNRFPGDGCDPRCEVEPRACASGVTTLGEDLERGIGACKDRSNATCEQDFAQLCAPGWHLCSATEHVRLNDGVIIELGDMSAVGVIRCRSQGGSGHYTTHNFNVDGPDNCEIGSSRVDCPTNLGCNEGIHAALCCAPRSSCGNGVVDDPLEECDDGNADDFDACSNACANRTASGPHC